MKNDPEWKAELGGRLEAYFLGEVVDFRRAVSPAPRTVFSLGAMTRGRHVREVPFEDGVAKSAPETQIESDVHRQRCHAAEDGSLHVQDAIKR